MRCCGRSSALPAASKRCNEKDWRIRRSFSSDQEGFHDKRRGLCTAPPLPLSGEVPSLAPGAGLCPGEGIRRDPQSCGGFCPSAAGSGTSPKRWAADPHARASGVRGPARLRLLLPGMSGKMVSGPSGTASQRGAAGADRELFDGVDLPGSRGGLTKRRGETPVRTQRAGRRRRPAFFRSAGRICRGSCTAWYSFSHPKDRGEEKPKGEEVHRMNQRRGRGG